MVARVIFAIDTGEALELGKESFLIPSKAVFDAFLNACLVLSPVCVVFPRGSILQSAIPPPSSSTAV